MDQTQVQTYRLPTHYAYSRSVNFWEVVHFKAREGEPFDLSPREFDPIPGWA